MIVLIQRFRLIIVLLVVLPSVVLGVPFKSKQASSLYEGFLRGFLLQKGPITILEGGPGTGKRMMRAILSTKFKGRVIGVERDAIAFGKASKRIDAHWSKLGSRYTVFHNDVLRYAADKSVHYDILVMFPPWLPRPNGHSLSKLLPLVYSGEKGSEFTLNLLHKTKEKTREYALMLDSISNPLEVLEAFNKEGYHVQGYLAAEIPWGPYMKEAHILEHIRQLSQQPIPTSFFREGATAAESTHRMAMVHFVRNVEPVIDGSKTYLQDLNTLLYTRHLNTLKQWLSYSNPQ